MKVFKVGDTVEVNGRSEYNDRGNIPIGTIGKIKEIRRRYVNTPNEYNVYKLSFDCIPDGDVLTYNYQSMNFTKIVGKIVSMSIPEGYDVSIIGDVSSDMEVNVIDVVTLINYILSSWLILK